MAQTSIPQSDFNMQEYIQEYIADTLSDENFAAKGEFLVQGAKDVRHVVSTVMEWYRGLGPGQFALWYQALNPEVVMQWYNTLFEWSKTPR